MATGKPTSEEKFRELVLYITLQSDGDEWFGVTKLNKLLYFIDAESLREFGATLSGQEYIKRPFGPVPARISEALNTLRDTDALVIRPEIAGPYRQRRPFAMREPDWEQFHPRELALVNSVIQQFKGWAATQCSTVSHERSGWRLAIDGERLPVGADLVSERELTAEERAYACELTKLPEYKEFVSARDS